MPDGTPGALYSNVTAAGHNASNTKQYEMITENGAQYSLLKEPSAMPGDTEPTLLWMLIIPAPIPGQ